MIVRRHLIPVLTIVLTFWAHTASTKGERWSRQVLNSEWIPLANPRSLQPGTGSLSGLTSGVGNPAQALPPVLREQYQQQLLQLQETQESIQKLLQLQQQLRAQQQLLQAQSYVPESFSNDDERKSALAHSVIANLQTLPQLAPGALLPSPPADQPQLPEFTAQNFLVRNPPNAVQNEQRQDNHGSGEQNREQTQENGSGINQEKTRDHSSGRGNYNSAKQVMDSRAPQQFISQTTQSSVQDENQGEEEVQLLYVPAETLAQRDPNKKSQRVRNRKQFSSQQQQQQSRQQARYQQQGDDLGNQGLEGTRPSAAQQAFAHRVLYQLQQDQAERTRLQQEEREKEIARLRDEEKELERQAKYHQELVAKEQELKRQKEIDLQKELERQEEAARQKELERIRAEDAARKEETERQLVLERRKIAEIRARSEAEERQAEIDRLAALERQKEAEIQRALEQQQEIERQQAEEEARARTQLEAHRQAHQDNIEKQKQAQIDAAALDARNRAQNQAQQQHLTETTRPKGNRQRPRKQPPPNQPPLSVYMGSISPVTNPEDLRVSDVLTILKDAKTISVLETVGQNIPQVFVGPTSLEPPSGYAKFDLPYLSAIDNNRVERKVDKLPFFVAPLSFKPPPGYSKIPFPAPHIGSVVVNTLDNGIESLDGRRTEQALRPLIEPNSYQGDHFAPQATPDYPQDGFVSSSTPRYEATYSSTPASGTRYRHRQFYNDRNQHVVSTTEPLVGTRTKFRQYYQEEQATPQPQYQETTAGQEQNDGGRLNPVVQEEHQTVGNTFQNLNQDYVASQLQYPANEQTVRSEYTAAHQTEETRTTSVEPTQYTISSELPKISSQLPGLVNSLIEQREQIAKTVPSTTTPATTTTTTTTTETPTTTYRARGRQRGRLVPTRAPTTTENVPTRSSVTERPRRPYSRSRVRQGYATTTETYHETIHETPKTKFSGTEEKNHFSGNEQPQRRPVQRTQRYRGRGGDKNAVQPEARPELDENYPAKHSIQGPSAIQNSNAPIYREEATVPSATPQLAESLRPNAQPLQAVSEAAVTLEPGANYPTNFGQTRVEQSPVNGFNYQSQNEKFPEAGVQHQYQTTDSFDHQRSQSPEQIYNFNGNQAPSSPGTVNIDHFHNTDVNRQAYGFNTQGSQNSFQDSDSLKVPEQQATAPVFDHPEDHLIQAPPNPTTETPEPTLTPAPLTVRHRVRGRPQRPHADAPIQTRPTGSRDEFVRFSAVNQDNVRQHSSGRVQSGTRQRQRNRQGNQASVQTEGNDFVRLGSPAQRTTTTTTTSTTQAPQKEFEDVEYGFIRPPSFKPIHPVGDVAPTFRPKYEQIQTEEPTNDAPVEVNTPQSQIIKNRQKYHVMNRRPLTRSTAAPQQLTTTAQPPVQEEDYTVKPFDNQSVRNRGRVRRPGKRRTTTTSTTTTTTTTTTESILDSSNELPHDENYPQIIQGVPATQPESPRRTLFDEELKSPHLETLPQAEALQRPGQSHPFQHQDNTQFSGQDFVLNFGLGPDHEDAHDQEYDQTQIASTAHNQRKYSQINRGNFHPRPGINPVADIEGAESQWSTKLTHSSFQPSSLVNQVPGGGKNAERQDKSEDSFDIITAGPDLASVDVLVTSNGTHEPRDIVVNASYLGNAKKEGLELKEPRRRPVIEGRAIVERKNDTFGEDNPTLDKLQFWNNGEDEETILKIEEPERTQLNPDGFTETPKIGEETTNFSSGHTEADADAEEPTTTKRTVQRRRRIRVRVRPADDFVSAESQHVGSTWNSLVREKQNYDKSSRVEDFKTTIVPSTSSTTEATSVKTFLEELLGEMTKDSVAEATPTTTDAPDVNRTTTSEGRTEVPEATTTPTTTTSFNSGDFGSTTVPEVVTDVTTDKSPEPLVESLEKVGRTESVLQQHKFRPKNPHKSWWNHNFETETETPKTKPEGERTVTSTVAADPEDSTSEATATTITEETEHSLSDYMDAFFGTVPNAEDHEEKKIEETAITVEDSESSGVKIIEEETRSREDKETKVAPEEISEENKSNVSDSAEPEEFQKMTNTEDSTTLKAAEEVITTLGQETTTIFVPQTTPEVPLSPEELTTEIPSTTTTSKPNTSPNNQMAKVLRTSTTTEVSHMTEICYRGRCVKTKSRKEVKRK